MGKYKFKSEVANRERTDILNGTRIGEILTIDGRPYKIKEKIDHKIVGGNDINDFIYEIDLDKHPKIREFLETA